MKCPKKYSSFDVSNWDCKDCKKGKLYRGCGGCNKASACAGWMDDEDVYCCKCYEKKHGEVK